MTSPRWSSERRLVFSIARLEVRRLAEIFAAARDPIDRPIQELRRADPRCAEEIARPPGVSDEARFEFGPGENGALAEPLPDRLRGFAHAESFRSGEIENERRRVDVLEGEQRLGVVVALP